MIGNYGGKSSIWDRTLYNSKHRPFLIDMTRSTHRIDIIQAYSYHDEYFVEEVEENPLVLMVDALLSTLTQDVREVIEMCVLGNMSMHEAARELGYINSSGKEDHKMVKRRIVKGLKELRKQLTEPSFATALAGYALPDEQPDPVATQALSSVISDIVKSLDKELLEMADTNE